MTRKTPLLLLPLALLLALSACKPSQEPTPASSQPPAQAPTPTTPAPVEETPAERTTAEFPTLKMKAVDGSDYDLAAHRGKWVIVNFWATWCAPCRKEMPELSALHAMRSNIEVVGLAYEDIEVPEMQSFLTKHPVTYPIVIVDPFDPPADFATPRGLPLTHLLDPQGKLAHTFLGPVTAADIEKQIASAK
ncbi:TlpA family protein disulfide reductase [Stenotrophomonas maltophilia]|uniref:TlpA family protein disulfide reductase n=1 Tax=Stenotrophomonas maltophilia TaxID=40324 RepID=UPI00050A0879|nr:TlpA disulfide reductase family protein [Stenotrophomonas maltophilia]KGM21721.1 thioredoxin [Stenotrophomonas maltophilia]